MAPISNINVGAFVANIAAHQDAGHTAGLDPKFNQPKWELFKDKDFTDILVNAGGQALLNEVYNAAPKTQDLMCVLSFAETFHLDAGEIRALADEIRPLPNASKNPAHVINSPIIQAKMAGMNHVQTEFAALNRDISRFVKNGLEGSSVQSLMQPHERKRFTDEIKKAFSQGTAITRGNPIASRGYVKEHLTVRAAFDRFNQLQDQLRNMPRVNDLQAQAAANFAKLNEVLGDPRFRPVVVAPPLPPRPKGPGAAPKGPGVVIAPPPPPPADELEPPAGPFEGLDFDEEFDIVVIEEDSDVSDSEMSDSESEVIESEEDIPPPPGDVVHPPEVNVPPEPVVGAAPPPPPPQPPKGWKPKAPGAQPAPPKGGAQPAPPKGAPPKGYGGHVDPALQNALNVINQQVRDSDSESDDSNNESWED